MNEFASLAVPIVVILTISGAASEENFVNMRTLPFQCVAIMLFIQCE